MFIHQPGRYFVLQSFGETSVEKTVRKRAKKLNVSKPVILNLLFYYKFLFISNLTNYLYYIPILQICQHLPAGFSDGYCMFKMSR